MQITEAEIVPLYEAALKGGIQVATHAIGDRGNASVADWYAQALAAVPASERPDGADVRWRIEHAQILRPADYQDFVDLPIIASMQPSHAIGTCISPRPAWATRVWMGPMPGTAWWIAA
jgi:predicted amidohydrolase YtcJ